LDAVGGRPPLGISLGVRLRVAELHELRKGRGVLRVLLRLLLGGADVSIEGARAAPAASAPEQIADAEPAAASADAEQHEAGREDGRERAEGDADHAAATGALKVEKHGEEA